MVEGLTYIESPARSALLEQRRASTSGILPYSNGAANEPRHPSRGRAVAARRAHNPEVAGSNPAPATPAPVSSPDRGFLLSSVASPLRR